MDRARWGFSVAVADVKGSCPAGEAYAKQNILERKTPVFSCEGPCIRGDIARRAATLVAQELPSCARACHGEAFFVPQSAMASWVKTADRCIMIDGCFLKCHGRVLSQLVGEERMVQIDALPLHKKYSDVFSMDDIPETERQAVAREVADKIVALLQMEGSGSTEVTRSAAAPKGRSSSGGDQPDGVAVPNGGALAGGGGCSS